MAADIADLITKASNITALTGGHVCVKSHILAFTEMLPSC